MAQTKKAENQYYVPRMLLKNFTISNTEQVYVFDKWNDRSFRTNIKNVASERSFYQFSFGNHQSTLEPELSRLETAAENALRKVIDASSLSVLSPEERIWIGIFVAAQHVRSRGFREMSRDLDNQ